MIYSTNQCRRYSEMIKFIYVWVSMSFVQKYKIRPTNTRNTENLIFSFWHWLITFIELLYNQKEIDERRNDDSQLICMWGKPFALFNSWNSRQMRICSYFFNSHLTNDNTFITLIALHRTTLFTYSFTHVLFM